VITIQFEALEAGDIPEIKARPGGLALDFRARGVYQAMWTVAGTLVGAPPLREAGT